MDQKQADCINCGMTITYGPEIYLLQTSVAQRHGIGGSVTVHNHVNSQHRILECQEFIIASCTLSQNIGKEVTTLLDLIKAHYEKQLEEDMNVAAG